MNELEIKNLWQLKTEQLEKKFAITEQYIADATKVRAKGIITSMQPVKIFTVIIGILWVLFVDTVLVVAWNEANPFFLFSAMIQVITIKLAIGMYLYQLVLISQVDITEPVLASQQRLAKLKISTLWSTRILVLQLPTWTTFYLRTGMFSMGNIPVLFIQVAITMLFTWFAIWLFVNIRFENRDKKWFRLLFSGKSWTPIMKSMDLLKQIGEFQK